MKVLVLDIEISPTIATVWGLFNQNIGVHNIIGNSEVLCWAAKWTDSEEVLFASKRSTSKRRMLKAIHRLLEQADAVVTYNGDSFDLKILNKEFALQGWGPPAPYKSVDMYRTVKRRFRFTSNKLGYVCSMLGIGDKEKDVSHQVWLSCMNPKASDYSEAWDIMERYNIKDVTLLEELYTQLKGWSHNHPNISVRDGKHCCPNCGSEDMQSRGYYFTSTLRYKRHRCNSCGKWSRSAKADKVARADTKLIGIT